ncbi:MAG: glutamyl-tRNA reductase [Deltaproteobacteria bacterium]|nr:glutamyl-tRNA reductase [Deltaproteobacteria bacterium]
MDLILVGLNHKTAPVRLRESLAFDRGQAAAAVAELVRTEPLAEALLLSTCNRVEVVAATEQPRAGFTAVKNYLARSRGLALSEFEHALYVRQGDEAVRHLFRVAASLDSMVLGEPQILGQIKDAYRLAVNAKASGVILNRLFHRAFSVAKRVRRETGIGGRAVSISYAAVELAKKIFEDLGGKNVLLLGAGEMAELAVEHLLANRAASVMVINRTFERAVDLARRFSGKPLRWEEMVPALSGADIVISSTSAPGLVLEKAAVQKVLRPRKNRPLFFIDIAVPRDIDPAINKLPNCYVYDIDDLASVVQKNKDERKKEAVAAERIVDEGVIGFRRWLSDLDAVPTIKDLKDKLESIRVQEMKKTLPGMEGLSGADRDALERMTRAMMRKILHDPILYLKQEGGHREAKRREILNLAREMFNLDSRRDAD